MIITNEPITTTTITTSTTPAMMTTKPQLTYLPVGYVPTQRDVVIGKGKRYYHHGGNVWLRSIVAQRINEYATAKLRSDKSRIISKTVEYVQQNGQFIRLENTQGASRWILAEPLLSREKCSQTFRDYLAQTYKSSNVAKRNKRRQEQLEKTLMHHQDMSSSTNNKRRKTTTTTTMMAAATDTTTSGTADAVSSPWMMMVLSRQESSSTTASSSSASSSSSTSSSSSSPTDCATWFDWENPLGVENLLGEEDQIMIEDNSLLFSPSLDLEPAPFLPTSNNSSTITFMNTNKKVDTTLFSQQNPWHQYHVMNGSIINNNGGNTNNNEFVAALPCNDSRRFSSVVAFAA